MSTFRLLPACVLAPTRPFAAWSQGHAALPSTVVSATRTEADPLAVPAAVDRIDDAQLRLARPQVNISEALGGAPGLQARERQNYAQDLQLSMRGFGTRATFGIGGLRLYVDGIPATQPDGRGLLSHVDLALAERIEVLRRPFSALCRNSSGGVLQGFTEEGRGAPALRLDTATGSDGLLRFGVNAGGTTGANDSGVGYLVSATDGYREHSAARRILANANANAKLTRRPHEDGKLTLAANRVVLPKAQDPQCLCRAQWQANPRDVDPADLNFDTRKRMEQTQAGLIYEHYLSEAHALQATLYGGQRGTTQFHPIPGGAQTNPRHPGGVIDLDRDYAGADLRWTLRMRLADASLTVVAGLAYDGLRHSRIRFGSQDLYIAGVNPDDSGSARYGATSLALGASFAIAEELRVYASAGKGFSVPDRHRGRDRDQHSQRAVQGNELRAHAAQRAGAVLGAALRADLAHAGGRHRAGRALPRWCPCRRPHARAGQKQPVHQRRLGAAAGLCAGADSRVLSKVLVNDTNSDAAAGYVVFGAFAGYATQVGRWQLEGFLRADNLVDKGYAGSVIVNEGNSRFFEPAPGPTWLLGLSARMEL